MPFSLLLALLCALIAAELSPQTPVERPLLALLAVLLVAAVTPVYAMLITRSGRIERRYANLDLVARFDQQRLRAFFEVVWIVSVAVIALGTSWCQLVRVNWQLADAVLVDELLILTPVFLPLLLAWSILQNGGLHHRSSLAKQSVASSLRCRLREIGQLARDHLLVLLAPVLVLVAVKDIMCWVAPSWEQGGWDWWLYAPVLVAMFLGLPLFLRYLWQTEPLPPGQLCDRLEHAARRAGVEMKHIRVWHTGGAIANAVVTGMTSAVRHVFLTDRLVRHLAPAEIEAVFLHELGHVRHRHLPLRAAVVLLPVCAWVAFVPQSLASTPVVASVAVLSLVAAYGWWVFGAFSQRLERQADLFACRQLAAAAALPTQSARADLPAAVAVYSGALEHLAALNGIDSDKRTWQHGSVADRVAWLREVQHRPRAVRQFQSRLRIVGSLVFGLIVGLAAHLASVASVWAS